MRKIFNILALLFVATLATSCLYGKGFGEETNVEDTSGFKTEVSANVIIANGEDTAVFRALFNGTDVSAESTLYDAATNEPLEEMAFSTFTAGRYTFYIVYGEYRSEDIVVTAVQDLDLADKEEEGLSAVQIGRAHV